MEKVTKLEGLKVQSFTTTAMNAVYGGEPGTEFPMCDEYSMLEPCTGTKSQDYLGCDATVIEVLS